MSNMRNKLIIESPNIWYLVGLIASDGYLSSDGRHIDITSIDYEFLKGVRDLFGVNNKIGTKYNSNNQKSFRIQIANRDFYNFLSSTGLSPNKSLSIASLDIPNEFFSDFLRGLIDGDGGILKWFHSANFKEQWSLRISSGSNNFLEWLRDKIEEIFRAKGKIYQDNARGTSFKLKYGKVAARKILEECYYKGCFGLERKVKLAHECVNSYQGWSRSKAVLN